MFDCCGLWYVLFDVYECVWCGFDDVCEVNLGVVVLIVWDWWESDWYVVYCVKCLDCGKWGVDNEYVGF